MFRIFLTSEATKLFLKNFKDLAVPLKEEAVIFNI